MIFLLELGEFGISVYVIPDENVMTPPHKRFLCFSHIFIHHWIDWEINVFFDANEGKIHVA